MTKAPSVWIVVLNWNGKSDTLDCLRSLRQLRYPERRIVVVDNGSTDGSVDCAPGGGVGCLDRIDRVRQQILVTPGATTSAFATRSSAAPISSSC